VLCPYKCAFGSYR